MRNEKKLTALLKAALQQQPAILGAFLQSEATLTPPRTRTQTRTQTRTLTLTPTLTPTLTLTRTLIKVADFGSAKRLAGTGPAAYAHTPCGSMGYAAPEQISHQQYEREVC